MYRMRKLRVKFLFVAILLAVLAIGPTAGESTSAGAAKPKYQIRVDLTENLVFIDEWNAELGDYAPTEHVFLCSPGTSRRTPTGTFTARPLATDWQYDPMGTGEWVRFRYWPSCYVNSATVITGSIIFHSVPSSAPNYKNVSQSDIDKMGTAASHGCVRLWPRQAAWIRQNCIGATIKIYYGPGKSDELWNLRELLKAEIPSKDIWPNTVVTENTKYIYTYYGDTMWTLAELGGITADELVTLNPDLKLKEGVAVGLAVRIK